jgi:type II secretory pathway pseudopilin PulG
MSLLELLAVITLIGVFSTVVMTRYGRSLLGDTGARSKARELSLGLLQAQRSAIRTGEAHGVIFTGTLTNISSWSVVRIAQNGSQTVVDGPVPMGTDFRLGVNKDSIVFDFEGNGQSELQATLAGPDRTWQVSVLPLTRMIDSREVR